MSEQRSSFCSHYVLQFSRIAALVVFTALVFGSDVGKPNPAFAAGYTVNSLADDDDGSCDAAPGDCTLREAINAANDNTGADTITFSVTGTITLTAMLPDITDATGLTIEAEGVTVDGDNLYRPFTVASGGSLTLEKITITHGLSHTGGGGIHNDGGTVILNDSTVTASVSNSSDGLNYGGGGINSTNGTLTLNRSTVSNNDASGSGGGGIFGNQSTITLTDSTVSGNTFLSNGGGIFNLAGIVTLVRSTVSGNTATTGGGIYNTYSGRTGGTLTLTNSTVSGNLDRAVNSAGGIFNVSSSITLTNSTIVGNDSVAGAGSGRGIANTGTVQISNTLIAGNAGPNCSGDRITSQGYNLSDDNTCTSFTSTGDQNDITDAMTYLGSLAANGGYTKTHALLEDSTAIDAIGAAACTLTLDQRSKTRPADGDDDGTALCDIGAFEVQGGTAAGEADLSVTKSAPAKVYAGDEISYTITVKNLGPDAATNPEWTDSLPANTTYVSLSKPDGWTCDTSTPQISCSASSLEDQEEATFTLVVAVATPLAADTVISNLVEVSSETDDPESDNDKSTAQTTVVSEPLLSINDVSQNEGNSGTTTFTFTVSLSAAALNDVSFDITTADGTATVADNDYVARSLTGQVILQGATTYRFDVTVNGDLKYEGNDSFAVRLSNITGAAAGDTEGTGTIQNDDTAPALSIDDVTLDEGDSGTTSFVFTVSRSGLSSEAVSVDVDTEDGTATAADDDYTALDTTITFPADSTSLTQTVTVEVNGDQVQEDDETFTVRLSNPVNATIGDGEGTGTITNDDTAGVTVTPTSGLVTTEAGATATFTVVLDSEPTADVTISVTSSDDTEGTVSPTTLTFTAANWSSAQTVTVTGVNDDLDDGDIAYSVSMTAASSDPLYDGITVTSVSATNLDDDTAGVTVSPTSGLVTTEAGDSATFTVVLDSQPTADVTVTVTSSDDTEGTVSPTTLTFTAANWSTAQTVTVTGVNDDLDDGDIAYSISMTAASSDPLYDGITVTSVSATNLDDDTAGVTVTPTSGLVTTEAGATATFTVVLTSQPTADVTISVSSSDDTEGTVSPMTLTFTAANWSTAQTITVTGVDDSLDDGDIAYSVSMTAASSDPLYDGITVTSVGVTNLDDDGAGVTVSPTSLVTFEAGGPSFLAFAADSIAQFTVVLDSQPTADVTISVSSSDPSEGTVSPTTLTFTAANWNLPQTVTVTAVDDDVDDGNVTYVIPISVTSADPLYDGISVVGVSVTNVDNDRAGFEVSPHGGLVTTEAGGQATFTVALTSQPTATVRIGLSSNDPSEGSVSPATLVFTAANWNIPQTVTVTGVDDDIVDGDIAYRIVLSVSSNDPVYERIHIRDVEVTNRDNDRRATGATPAPTQTPMDDNCCDLPFEMPTTTPTQTPQAAPATSTPTPTATTAPSRGGSAIVPPSTGSGGLR